MAHPLEIVSAIPKQLLAITKLRIDILHVSNTFKQIWAALTIVIPSVCLRTAAEDRFARDATETGHDTLIRFVPVNSDPATTQLDLSPAKSVARVGYCRHRIRTRTSAEFFLPWCLADRSKPQPLLRAERKLDGVNVFWSAERGVSGLFGG